MDISGRRLIWGNDRFGGWLVCRELEQTRQREVFGLWYWDVVANRGVEGGRCAKVNLVVEDVGGEV